MKTGTDYLNEFLDKIVVKLGLPGLDCTVWKDHAQIYRHAAGYADIEAQKAPTPDLYYNIYSATKVVTVTAAMQCVEMGLLRLNDPLWFYLPAFRNMKVKYGNYTVLPAQNELRVNHLLSMTSGISYDQQTPEKRAFFAGNDYCTTTREFADCVAAEPLMFEPGTRWLYGFSHDILGAVIEAASGMRFGDYLKKNIFEPLGMENTFFVLPDDRKKHKAPQYTYDVETRKLNRISSDCILQFGPDYESGGGGLITKVDDYILLADALACGGVGKTGKRILSPNSIRVMSTNQLNADCLNDFHKMIPSEGNGYGLGVSTVMDPAASFTLAPKGAFTWGGLAGAQNIMDPENHVSMFVAQHAINTPKYWINPNIIAILYGKILPELQEA